MMARSSKAPSIGRIQKRKTNFSKSSLFGLQRAAGPYRWANERHDSLHSITSSAATSSVAGTVRPSAFAAFFSPLLRFLRFYMGSSAEELHRARFQVVHRAGDLDRAFGFQLREHGAIFPDVGHRQLDVLARHGVHERVVLAERSPV